MYKVTKEVINSIGNVQSTIEIGFVDIRTEQELDAVLSSHHGLAKASNYYYKLRGRQDRVRYIISEIAVANAATVVSLNKADIALRIDEANDYINTLNIAAKRSARINSRKDVDLLQHVKVDDYWLDYKDYVEHDEKHNRYYVE